MPQFAAKYRKLFATFGHPLTAASGVPAGRIAKAENRLGVRIPKALREYLLVAGKERRFNRCYNRLLPLAQWRVEKGKLVFMEENQGVVEWAVPARKPDAAGKDDPAVFQGVVEDDGITWYKEHRRFSEWIAVALHYQAVNGGLRRCGAGLASDTSDHRFDKHGWTSYGTVNGLTSWSRTGQVVCLSPPDSFAVARWTVLAGGRTRRDLRAIGEELGIDVDS